jgi:hypothetical protein
MATQYAKFESYLETAMKAVLAGEARNRKRASAHLYQKIKAKAEGMRDTGALAKGCYKLDTRAKSFVGCKAPHAYLVEFGTVERFQKTRGNKSVGASPAKPFVYPTFAEEAGAVAAIMSEPWDIT